MKELDDIRSMIDAGDYDWENCHTVAVMDRMERALRAYLELQYWCWCDNDLKTCCEICKARNKAQAIMRGEDG